MILPTEIPQSHYALCVFVPYPLHGPVPKCVILATSPSRPPLEDAKALLHRFLRSFYFNSMTIGPNREFYPHPPEHWELQVLTAVDAIVHCHAFSQAALLVDAEFARTLTPCHATP